MKPSLDFETYSAAGFEIRHDGKVVGIGSQGKGGLSVVGTAVYFEHPSTRILSLSYDLKDGLGVRRWRPGFPDPADLIEHVRQGRILEAWNATFEWWAWGMICVRQFGWPVLPLHQTYCAMAKARRFNLPGSLGAATNVLGTAQKDSAGENLIQKLCRPHTPTKNRKDIRWTPQTAPDDFARLYDYNDQDVRAEDEASARIPELSDIERQVWLADQTVNARGVQVDVPTLDAALYLLAATEARFTMELCAITGGEVGSVSEVAKFGKWLTAQGVCLPDLTSETVEAALEQGGLPQDAHRALEIRALLGAANVKKLRTLKHQLSRDGRLRNQYMYCGADRTGRWSAGGVQLQNITAKGPKIAQCDACGGIFSDRAAEQPCPRCGAAGHFWRSIGAWSVDAVKQAKQDVQARDLDRLIAIWGDPISVLCGCLRGLFIPNPGRKFICVDYSSIEAVVTACLAGCQWRIDVFNGHGNIYAASASQATGIPLDEILAYKKQHGVHHPARNGIGKVRELAGGFGGWVNAWKNFGAEKYFEDDEAIKRDVLKWRAESPEIVEMWGGQYRQIGPRLSDAVWEPYGLEGMAVLACLNPGRVFNCRAISFWSADDILYMRLPSGRCLHYHRPRLDPDQDFLRRPCWRITFECYNTNATKGPIGWHRFDTYGGRLWENCIAEGTLVLTKRGWVPIQWVTERDQVHDGVDWVRSGGLLYKHVQTCIPIDGVWMTPDHEVLTDDGWREAKTTPRPYRPDLRGVDGSTVGTVYGEKEPLGVSLHLRKHLRESRLGSDERGSEGPDSELRVQDEGADRTRQYAPRDEQALRLRGVPLNGRSLHFTDAPSMEKLRRARDYGLRFVASVLRKLLAGHERRVSERATTRPAGQHGGVLQGELPMGSGQGQLQQQKVERGAQHPVGADDDVSGFRGERDRENHPMLQAGSRVARRESVCPAGLSEQRHVYDIANCGPRQRFIVMGDSGPFIVHNCVQATARDIQALAMVRAEQAGYPVVMHTHDELTAEVPDTPYYTVAGLASVMIQRPEWAHDWPIKAAGWEDYLYQKD